MIFNLKKEKKHFYIEEGQGHPLVLLHGLMGGLSNFDALLNFFPKKGYRVIVPSLPLYELPLLRTNISNLSKYVIQFLKDKEIYKATLIGNSLGGHLTLDIAKKKPELVHSFVLTGSSGLYERAFGDSFPKRGNYEYVKKKSQEVFYNPKIATKELVDEVYQIVNDRVKAIRTLYIAKSAIKHNMAKDLPFIQQPAYLIWGKQDNVTPPEVAKEFHRLLPHSDLHWIDQCGHAPMMEHPEKFITILEKWISQFHLNHGHSKG
ncbi:MAG: alpha/beta fold hydrolase [Flavobacteriales bacterium Tduv]